MKLLYTELPFPPIPLFYIKVILRVHSPLEGVEADEEPAQVSLR
jgi:hypothetical protein